MHLIPQSAAFDSAPGAFSAPDALAQANSFTNLPILKDTSSSTSGLFLGAVCPELTAVTCESYAAVFRHGLALGTVYTDWAHDVGTYLQWGGEGSWPAQGMLADVTWQPTNRVTFNGINRGDYDSYITKTAKELKSYGHPIFVRPFHEFNGNWYPWGLANQGANSATDTAFINAWRRMVDIFRREGATNVRFVWCFSTGGLHNYAEWNRPINAYPGDAYVDWIAFDAYNRGSKGSGKWKWETFDEIVKQSYPLAVAISSKKPLAVIEVASNEYGDGGSMKSGWIDHMFSELKSGSKNPYPHIRVMSWFESDIKGFKYDQKTTSPAWTSSVYDVRSKNTNGVLDVRSNGLALDKVTAP